MYYKKLTTLIYLSRGKKIINIKHKRPLSACVKSFIFILDINILYVLRNNPCIFPFFLWGYMEITGESQ